MLTLTDRYISEVIRHLRRTQRDISSRSPAPSGHGGRRLRVSGEPRHTTMTRVDCPQPAGGPCGTGVDTGSASLPWFDVTRSGGPASAMRSPHDHVSAGITYVHLRYAIGGLIGRRCRPWRKLMWVFTIWTLVVMSWA